MNWAIAWVKNRDNWNAVLHNVIANVVVAGAAAVGFMIWTYLSGLPLPFVAIAGIAAPGAVLLTFREIGAFLENAVNPHASGETVALRERLDALEGELKSARSKIAAAESNEATVKRHQEDEIRRNAGRVDRLHATKEALKSHIDTAPKVFNFDDMNAWSEGSNHLLGRLNLARVPNRLERPADDETNKRWFQENVAHVRSYLVTLKYTDMPWS
jgi:hypothetical protein